ncbi:ABC transporter substrate-binding protein [Pseudonocardia kujensis]|uniref:ABC transporter substrate-binding protein n=1 Tax=Pseudonocardia kujensis TaxID=1128675 RepID=UPI001E462670|nr:ABC transporter substrate-binding protein [Pseudonocardia kujensis]MCE0763694.1 ABC transporter substrate-binding protein [Pseudonocardia kujensis]
MPRRLGLLALAVLCTATTACGSSATEGAPTPEKIRVTVSNATEPYVIPWLVGDQEGLFEAHGVAVDEIVAGQGGSTTLRNLMSGDLAVGEVSLPAVIDAKLAGTPVTVVGGATRSVYGLDFYALASGPVQTIADARRWAFSSPGSVSESLTHLVPEAAGLAPDAVERVGAGGIGEGVALLEAGEVDVALVPTSLVAKDPQRFRLIASSADYVPAFEQSVMTVRDDYLAAHPRVISGVVAGYQDAVHRIEQDPQRAAEIYADYIGVGPDQARLVVDAALKAQNWSAGFDRPALDNAVRAMSAGGFTGTVPWCDLVDPSHLPEDVPRDLPLECAAAQ